MKKASRTIATAEPPTISRPFGVMFAITLRKFGIYLDLCVEDVRVGLDGLRANLRGELHGEAGALHRHDDLRRIGGRAVDERLRCLCGLRLRVLERRDRVREHAAEALAGALRARRALLGRADTADAADRPLGAGADGRDAGVDREDRHQRSRSNVFENMDFAVCMAVTFAS